MKRICLLFLCVFFISGCDVEYDLTINNNGIFDESVTMSFLKSDTDYNDVLAYKNSKIPVSRNVGDAPFYNSRVLDNGKYFDLIYSYTYDSDDISNSYFISNCFNGFDIVNNDDSLVLSSGNRFGCYIGDDGLKADSVKINITTELDVSYNNADEINGNTYTWNIDENNYLNKEINLTLKKDNGFSLNNIENSVVSNNDSSFIMGIIVVFIIVSGVLIYLFVKHRNRKNNDI